MDIYALDKGSQNRKVLTSHDEGVAITFDGQTPKLVQQSNLTYSLRADARFEVGSAAMYWSTGQSNGQLQLGKLVGDATGADILGGLGDFGARNDNARVAFNFDAGSGGGLTGDGVWSQVNATMTVGDMSITDGGVLSLANVEKQ
jgi:hypothetical protein